MVSPRNKRNSPSSPDWLAQMRALLAQSRLKSAAGLYDEHKAEAPAEATLMRARIHLKRKSEHLEAAALLRESWPTGASPQETAERELIFGIVETRSRGFDAADEHFARAGELNPSLRKTGELAYWIGRRFCEALEPETARIHLRELRAIEGAQSRVWSDTLESMILSQRERYMDAAVLVMRMVEFLDESQSARNEDLSWALHTVAVLARELDSPALRRFAKARVAIHEWNDEDFATNHFQAVKATAWCHALEGDYFNALRLLKAARQIPMSPPWQAMISLDRAYLARCFGETRFSREELADAEDILHLVHWRDTSDEERIALLLAAELFADVDSSQASRYLAKFTELRDAVNPLLHARYDRRFRAQADYATGVVQSRLGNRQAAATAYRRSWNAYHEIGYDWRSGRCALRLFELTGEKSWRDQAEEKLRNYPASWLYEELRAMKGDTDMPRLTPAQRLVFDLVMEGKSNQEISRITGRSTFTIQNHVNAVLRAFGVENRSALIADAIRRGLAGK